MEEREVSNASKALLQLQKVLMNFIQRSPQKDFRKNEAAKIDVRIGHISGFPVPRLVIHFRSNGCSWKQKTGGCTMCGFWNETSQFHEVITAADFIEQFKNVTAKVDISQYPILCLYNAGSVLNEEEIPFEALEVIFSTLSRFETLKQIALESRVEYVSKDKLSRLKGLVPDKELVIASGLESGNEKIRQLCVHKGLDRRVFEGYVELGHSLGIIQRIYLLIKPPFLTEQEAIDDAVSSARYLYALGIKDIHYEAMTIQENTLVHALYERGHYRPPWLWSILEILKQLSPDVKPFISPFRYIGDVQVAPHNCERCSDLVTDLILKQYCSHYDLNKLEQVDCPCRAQWIEELSQSDPLPIEERVLKITSRLLPPAEINNGL